MEKFTNLMNNLLGDACAAYKKDVYCYAQLSFRKYATDFSKSLIENYNTYYCTDRVEFYLNYVKDNSKWTDTVDEELSSLISQSSPDLPFSRPLFANKFLLLEVVQLKSLEEWISFHQLFKAKQQSNWWFLLGNHFLFINRKTSQVIRVCSQDEILTFFETFIDKYEFDHEFVMNHYNMCSIYQSLSADEIVCIKSRFLTKLAKEIREDPVAVHELFVQTLIDGFMLKSRGLSLNIFLHKAVTTYTDEENELYDRAVLKFFFFGEFFSRRLGLPGYAVTEKPRFAMFNLSKQMMNPLDAKRFILIDMMSTNTNLSNVVVDKYKNEAVHHVYTYDDFGAKMQNACDDSTEISLPSLAKLIRLVLGGHSCELTPILSFIPSLIMKWFVFDPFDDFILFFVNLMMLDLMEWDQNCVYALIERADKECVITQWLLCRRKQEFENENNRNNLGTVLSFSIDQSKEVLLENNALEWIRQRLNSTNF